MIRVSAVSLVLAFAGFQKFIERYISVMISYACEGIRWIWVWFEIFQYSFNVSPCYRAIFPARAYCQRLPLFTK